MQTPFPPILLILLLSMIKCQTYKKTIHTTDPDAKCLDGSPPAIYVHQGTQTDKFVVFLLGGGFCQGETQAQVIQQCYQRSKTDLGSSALMPDQLEGQGYLSVNAQDSVFANWIKIIIPYCDGALHQGYRAQSIKYKGVELFFKGSRILKAQLTYIQNKFNIKKASQVVWTGMSAGAVGAVLWSEYVREFLQNGPKIYNIIDSGIFLDFPTHNTGTHTFSTQLKTLYKLSNSEQQTPLPICNTQHPQSQWECFLLQHSYRYLEGKFLYLNSQYDSWSIPNIQKIECLIPIRSGIGYSLQNCTKAQINSIEKYREQYQKLIFIILGISDQNSCWSQACSAHVYACVKERYDVGEIRAPEGGVRVRGIVEGWVGSGGPRVVAMDLLAWPQNRPCAF